MKADADFRGGWYDPQKPPTLGPRAFARVYAGWGLSQPFYWKQVHFLNFTLPPLAHCCYITIRVLKQSSLQVHAQYSLSWPLIEVSLDFCGMTEL